MKYSYFNILSKKTPDNKFILYNTLSGGVIQLNEQYANLFKNGNQEDWEMDQAFLKNMTTGGFLIADNFDEKKFISDTNYSTNNEIEYFNYTIAPTLNCNFHCVYCYEEGHRYHTMSETTINQTIKYINDKRTNSTQGLSIAWYGGEPLLHPEIIEKITNGIRIDENYNAIIVTNGYYLDGKMAEFLKKMGVIHAQVTLDGPLIFTINEDLILLVMKIFFVF